MNRPGRLTIAAVVCLVVLAALATIFVLYPFSTVAHEPYATDLGTDSPPSNDGTFAVDQEIRIDEEGEFALELTNRLAVDGDEVRYDSDWIREAETTATTRYTDLDAEWQATRSWTDSADTYEDWLEYAGENETVDSVEDGYTRLSSEADPPSVDDQFDGYHTLGTDPLLSWLSFEFVGEETVGDRTVAVYEPKTGWYERVVSGHTVEEYRVTAADGELHRDAETGALRSADLTFTIVDASNYAEYLAEQWRGESVTVELTYAVHDDASVERPDWAEPPE